MSDLIDRQAAIEEVARRDTTDGTVKVFSGREIIEILNGLPSVQPERQWETCFDCPLSHSCPKIRGCTNDEAVEYASSVPNDCPLNRL